ncbi:MAG: type I-E CRISPR-associated endonuclease Cas1e [Myxococcota bacterium]
MMKGRLGLETARVPQTDRHGLLWLAFGRLYVEAGTLRFVCAAGGLYEAGDYAIPFQMLSCILLAPGTIVTHDAIRLLARHGTGLVAVGDDGVRFYASMPFGPDDSARARRQVRAWADPEGKLNVAKTMYRWRLGEEITGSSLNQLRGLEGARMRETYKLLAQKFNIQWRGRRYDRKNPSDTDDPNMAINHAATAVQAAAMIAVAVSGCIPQLGFIHEDSGRAFALDIADLHRDTITLPAAFSAVHRARKSRQPLERVTRKLVGEILKKKNTIPRMIDQIKELIDVDDHRRDPKRSG